MDSDAKRLFEMMFRNAESVCASPNKYGYHSIPLKEILERDVVTLVPTEESCAKRGLKWGPEYFESESTKNLTLVALNPINGWRRDENCMAFRNFLVEMDTGPLARQLEYVNRTGMPYSACIFSGGKSLHFLISLDKDLPNESIWRLLSEWTLNIVPLADPLTKNPSRSIRIPGALRENDNGEKSEQKLIEFHGPVKLSDLAAWLSKFPDAKPREKEEVEVSDIPNPDKLSAWVRRQLINGIDFSKGRNQTWFALACDFARSGFSEDDTLEFLENHFSPDRDFSRREWETTIKSAFKFIYRKHG